MSPSTPLGSGTGNAPNMYLHPRHYPPPQLPQHQQQPPQHPQPFMQHYLPMPHHYAPPLHHYAPPHFVQQYAGQPQYPQYPPMRPNTEIIPASSRALAAPVSSQAPTSSQALRLRPNPEPRPGVFSFDIDVIADDMKCGFCGETDMPWEDFKSRVLAFLESAADDVQLVYKFVGDNSRATQLNDAEAFSIAMDRLCHKVSNARTRVVALEVKNAAVKQTTTAKAKKRTRTDDIPPASNRTSGYDNHRRLDHAEMTLWAKKINITADPTAAKSKTPSPPPLSQPRHFDTTAWSKTPSPPPLSQPHAEVVLSSQVILLPEDVLSVIGNMGQRRARILRNYAKRTVLPLLGLINSYEEPEIPSPGTQNKGKECAVEAEDDTWQEGESWTDGYRSGESEEYTSDDETKGHEEFLT
ncbi:hypothetical protein EV424DRAFT_1353305 [Suillus variegatus]|nr:hypothetical protein EV424DRAFT_1353305 [Suillus variegatus]